jgi:hypothetical protein
MPHREWTVRTSMWKQGDCLGGYRRPGNRGWQLGLEGGGDGMRGAVSGHWVAKEELAEEMNAGLKKTKDFKVI